LGNDQLFKRRKAASEKDLRRRVVNRAPEKRILIVCEGEETERRYFKSLIASLKLSTVEVEICDECDSAPSRVVAFAERKARTEGSPTNGGYSQVFCVFDRDSHETYEAALSKVLDLDKNAKFPTKIKSIVSIPCFELWFILHFEYCRSPFAATEKKSVAEMVVSYLCRIKGFEAYEKSISSSHTEKLIALTDQAISNAKRAAADVEKTGESNPSTRVFEIIEYLREEKKKAEAEAAKSF
jgi:hypothetical protein